MSDRNIDPELEGFFRRVTPPEPSTRLRNAVSANRMQNHAGSGFGASADSRLGLSLAALAASVVLSAGLLFAFYGQTRIGNAGPNDSMSPSPVVSAGESISPSPADSPTATAERSVESSTEPSPTAVPSPTPTRDPAFTFGPAGKFMSAGIASVDPTMAALLPDGKVLLVGGDTTGNASQLYDPAAGKFTPTGTAAEYHWRGTLTRLLDGRVLLVGGFGLDAPVAVAEIYDPATGKYTSTGSLSTPRYDFSATLLHDGRVLVVGGGDWVNGDGAETYLNSAEIYDPATGSFSSAGEMSSARVHAAVVTLQDGRVLIAGGMSSQYYPSAASAEIYDPRTSKFTATGSMTKNRTHGVPTLLQDGRVLITGGDDDMMGTQYADLYDPATGKFTQTGPEAIDRVDHTATLLPDGRVLIAGGYAGPDFVASRDPSIFAMTESRYLSAAELYDPIKGTFTRIGNMTAYHIDGTATLLPNGRVLMAGGDSPAPYFNRADLYLP